MKRPGTSFHQFVQRIPADIKDKVRGTTLVVPVGEETIRLTLSQRAQDVRLAAQPDIGPLEEFVWNTFWALHHSRQSGMAGIQPIMVGEVMAYCALAGIPDATERMVLLRLVQAMDAELIAVSSERAERQGAGR